MELNKTKDFFFFFVQHHTLQISALLRFLSNMAATRQQCPALLLAEWWNSLWWQRWPIKYRSHWWHNTKTGFFFQDRPQTPVCPLWWIFIGSPWGRRLPDTLWRTWFADNLVKTETAFCCDPCAFQSRVTTWSAGRQLERRKKAIFIDQN